MKRSKLTWQVAQAIIKDHEYLLMEGCGNQTITDFFVAPLNEKDYEEFEKKLNMREDYELAMLPYKDRDVRIMCEMENNNNGKLDSVDFFKVLASKGIKLTKVYY